MPNNVPIRDWPEAIRPRERLIGDGPPALSDAQLLAIVIGSGTRARSAVAIAETLLHSIGGI
jgi:DNA repair protein RadC